MTSLGVVRVSRSAQLETPEAVPESSAPPSDAEPGRIVVGIGSSAGGIEALQELFAKLTPGGNATYVVAQHLAPDRPSAIVELLGHVCSLPVVTATNGQVIQSDTVYVGPPGQDVLVSGEHLQVVDPGVGFGPRPGIDELFRSIADSWGNRCVAVVLSGTGSDGSQGLREVNAAEGLTVVQRPESARFDAMPRSALALASADVVLDAGGIGEFLARSAVSGGDWTGESAPAPKPAQLSVVLAQLRKSTGLDLSGYRESTIQRQVRRRMAIRQTDTLADYLTLVDRDPEEAESLKQALLVSVTSFFRDPEAFAALREHLATTVAEAGSDRALRVWVPGCATGEEVYSLAMIVSELMGRPQDLSTRLKIFGTDLDDDALTVARSARYTGAALKAIPDELVKQYTVIQDGDVVVVPAIRDSVVFARHNLTEDPPFPRLDLVSCRNVLIYFTAPLQKRVLERLCYPLLRHGLLFLGASESVGPENPGLETLDPVFRIYRRSGLAVGLPNHASPLRDWRPPVSSATLRSTSVVRDRVPEEHVAVLEGLARLGPPCLVLDEHNDLLEVVGDVSAYCRLAPGRMTASALSYLRPELEAEARALLLAARSGAGPLQGRSLELTDGGGSVRLEVRPLELGNRGLRVLSFFSDTQPASPSTTVQRDPLLDQEMKRLERELFASQESLRTSLEELESTNEELQASSEELQAASEELQSSYEELETSNEELEATNSELTSANLQLREHGDELRRLNDELQNVQSSVNQGMVVVDRDLGVRRFTPLAVRLFGLVSEDLGQSLLDAPTTIPLPGFSEALHAVVGGAPRRDLEVRTDDAAYLIQVVPYIDSSGGLQGAIVTLTDIRELVSLRRTAQRSLAELEQITDALSEVVWKRSARTTELTYVSKRIETLTGYTPTEVLADAELLVSAIVEDDRQRVRQARDVADAGWDIEYQFQVRDGSTRWIREVASSAGSHAGDFVVGTWADISDRKAAEADAADRAMVFESVFDTTVFGIAVLDADSRITLANNTLSFLLGYEPELLVGLPLVSLCHPDERGAWDSDLAAARAASRLSGLLPVRRLVTAEGASVWADIDLRMLPHPVGSATALAIVQDVTEKRATTERLSRNARYDVLTGLVNRRTLYEVLDREMARSLRSGQALALVWVDLDSFKEVNDQFGHEVGDVVLRTAAERMRWTMRRQDVIGRLGGDEFGVVVSGLGGSDELDTWLDRLIEALAAPISEGGADIRVGGSLGVAVFPEDGTTPDTLMRAADHAMYAAKEAGGSSFAYYRRNMTRDAERRRVLRADLATALAGDSFRMWFQPIVTAQTGELDSVEALVRWQRDDQVIAAGEFVPFCEASGQIRPLGLRVIDLVEHDLSEFSEQGWSGLSVAVNLSVTQLADPATIERFRELLLPSVGHTIIVEVTESVFLPDHLKASDALAALERSGAKVSVDDFGSGFSNLRLLRSLGPDQVKLDQSFLSIDRDSAEGRALLRSAIEMAHAIGAKVVAEGVEYDWQLDLARELGVDLVQGYLVARPMPADELLAWLDERPQG